MLSQLVAVDRGEAIEADKPVERAWGEPTEGQVISIAAAKSVYEAGERIVLNVRIRNASAVDVPVNYPVGCPLDYDLTLRFVAGPWLGAGDRHGRVVAPRNSEVPYTLCGRLVLDVRQGGSSFSGMLKRGEERAVEIDLTRLYDMSLHGVYRITAQRQVWKSREADSKPSRATSNTIDITIKDRPYFQRVPRKIETPSDGKAAQPSSGP